MSYYIGVIGSVFSDHNTEDLKNKLIYLLEKALNSKENLADNDNDPNIYLVTGLINKGINKIAVELFKEKGFQTIGIDSSYAKTYDIVEVDKKIYISGFFGIENEFFIKNIDILLVLNKEERDIEKINLAISKNIPVLNYD